MRNFLVFFCVLNSMFSHAQVISTYAGNGSSVDTGDGNLAINAGLNRPSGAAFDKYNNLYTVQSNTHRIRKISSSGIITTIAGNGTSGFSGDGGLAINAQVNSPRWIELDKKGNIYIADGGNNRVRKIDTNGVITTIAGNGSSGYNGENILATSASMILPSGLSVDSIGNVYVCEVSRIRRIDTGGYISTIVGTGTSGFSGDGGFAISAQIQASRVYVNLSGDLIIVDYYRIRKVDASTGIIQTIAGTGVGAYNGDEISALSANINTVALAWDKIGNMFIADMGNDRVRMIDNTGIIHTVAGTGTAGFSGDGGLATLAEMYDPTGVAFDTCGNLYIPCKENHRVRKVTFNDTCGLLSTKALQALSKDIDIYPNPAQTKLSISASAEVAEVLIANTVGQVVCRKEGNGSGKMELDISDLQPGIYFVTVEDKQGVKVTKKVVKE